MVKVFNKLHKPKKSFLFHPDVDLLFCFSKHFHEAYDLLLHLWYSSIPSLNTKAASSASLLPTLSKPISPKYLGLIPWSSLQSYVKSPMYIQLSDTFEKSRHMLQIRTCWSSHGDFGNCSNVTVCLYQQRSESCKSCYFLWHSIEAKGGLWRSRTGKLLILLDSGELWRRLLRRP